MDFLKNTLESSSPIPERERGEVKINGVNVFASGEAENVLIRIAKRFSSQIELAVYFVGDNPSRLNLVVAPDPIMGIAGKEGHLQTKRELDGLIGRETEVIVRPGVERHIENNVVELGAQIITSSREFDEAKLHFVPLSELSLDRRLVRYLLIKSIQELFPGRNIEDVTDEDLKDLILNTKEFARLEQPYFNGGPKPRKIVTYLQDYFLQVDMFVSGRSLHPMRDFILFVLDQSNNKFQGGKFYGLSHVHYGWTEERVEQDIGLKTVRTIDPRWVELITYLDAMQIIADADSVMKMTDGKVRSRVIFVGVTALNPLDHSLIGSTYFDYANLLRPENSSDYNRFLNVVSQLRTRQNYDLYKEYYYLVRKYSPPYLPGYVIS